MPISQKDIPIGLVLHGAGVPIPFVWGGPGGIGSVRPENIHIGRSTRGTIIHTAGAAFLDDFGEGVPQLVISGHTGWNDGLPGVAKYLALEAIFLEYEQRRKRITAGGGDPSEVQLWYVDPLNVKAFSVYPHEFRLDRTKARPLLYCYTMRFSVLTDLLQDAVFGAIQDLSTSFAAGAEQLGALATV